MEIIMKTLLKSFALTALIFAFTVSATAQQRNNADRPRGNQYGQMHQADRGNQHQKTMSMLDLSDEQATAMKKIHLNGQKAMLPLRNKMREEQARLQTLTTSDSFDKSAVQKTVNTITQIRAELMMEQVTHHQKVRELLTEEQRIKFDTFKHKKHNAKLRQPFGNR
jgi:Spy/CpxP family protein refolding chaperone